MQPGTIDEPNLDNLNNAIPSTMFYQIDGVGRRNLSIFTAPLKASHGDTVKSHKTDPIDPPQS